MTDDALIEQVTMAPDTVRRKNQSYFFVYMKQFTWNRHVPFRLLCVEHYNTMTCTFTIDENVAIKTIPKKQDVL